MVYVKFKGQTPYPNTSYAFALAFEATVTEAELKAQSKEFAIENATRYSSCFDRDEEIQNIEDDWEYGEAYQDYVSACIDYGSWSFITEEKFNQIMES